MALAVKKVPEAEQWRTGLMDKLKTRKKEKYLAVSVSKRICAMIDWILDFLPWAIPSPNII
jgi:hypothetical protein